MATNPYNLGEPSSLGISETLTPNTTAGISVKEFGGPGGLRRAVVTLTNVAVTITDGASLHSGSQELFTFPPGQVLVFGGLADLSIVSATVAAITTSYAAVGSAAAGADADLTSTEENICVKTTLTHSTSAAFAADMKAKGTVLFADGTSSAAKAYLNFAGSDATQSGTFTVTGTIVITYANLGDI